MKRLGHRKTETTQIDADAIPERQQATVLSLGFAVTKTRRAKNRTHWDRPDSSA